jgi:histidinol-phosphatase (PHP family)
MVDSHIHTELSGDSSLLLEDVVHNASQWRLTGVCTAEHFDPIPTDIRFARYSYDDARARIVALRDRYPSVLIGLGVEVTYREEAEDQIRNFLIRHPMDMAIGSIHDIENMYLREWLRCDSPHVSLRTRLFPYITLLRKMSRSGLFDVLGHIDYIKRYEIGLRSIPLLKLFEHEIAETLEIQINHGGIIEVNVSGLRHPCHEAYPSLPILRLYRELGGRAVTIGSDAHAPEHMNLPLSLAVELAKDADLDIVDWRSFSKQ